MVEHSKSKSTQPSCQTTSRQPHPVQSFPAEKMLDLVVTLDVVDTVVFRDDDDAVVE